MQGSARPRSVILSGGGQYRDPWHPFGPTSLLLAAILQRAGHQVEIAEDVAARLANLQEADLIVANAAAGPPQEATTAAAALAGLQAALAKGVGVLAVHVGVCTMLRLPEWESVTGAAWVAGQTSHPKLGPSRVRVYPDRHRIVAPVRDFELTDERYTGLRLAADIVPLATHEVDGTLHPLLWVRELGRSRVVADALGHSEQSYDSPEHCLVLSRAVDWLTAPRQIG